jgi:hypothetical protein
MGLVCTGPQGIISVTDGEGIKHKIGRARNINVNSDYQRDHVFGIGRVHASEAPLLKYMGTVSVEQYAVLTNKAVLSAFDMTVQDNEKFFNYLLFERGIDITITTKRKVGNTVNEYPLMSIEQCLITSEGWSMAENAIWGRSGNFTFLAPPRTLSGQLPGVGVSE